MYKARNAKKPAQILIAYLGDYRRGFHVREIAKTVGISPSAASYMTRSLEKQRILNHKTEGKNKKYFINFENPSSKDMIVSAEIEKKRVVMERYFIIKKIANEIDFGSCIAVLFGSFAKAAAEDNSDIDMLLLGSCAKARKSLENFGKLYKKQAHAISMNEEDFVSREKREFINEIFKNHIVLSGSERFVGILWRIYHEP